MFTKGCVFVRTTGVDGGVGRDSSELSSPEGEEFFFMVLASSSIILLSLSTDSVFCSTALVSIWALAALIMPILASHSCMLLKEEDNGVVGAGSVMQVVRSATALDLFNFFGAGGCDPGKSLTAKFGLVVVGLFGGASAHAKYLQGSWSLFLGQV